MAVLDEVLFPGVPTAKWQMLNSDRMVLTGLLARVKPRYALEIGTYYGGSLSLIAQFAERVWAIDIDPDVPNRFRVPSNVELRIGKPSGLLASVLDEIESVGVSLNFILIDANHAADAVRRDIETVIRRPTLPREPCFILMHDSGNPECRRGIATADWASCPYVHYVELDFVPGQIIDRSDENERSEVWGGFAMAYLMPIARQHKLIVSGLAATSIAAIHRYVTENLGRYPKIQREADKGEV